MSIATTTTRLQLALRDRLRAYVAQRDPLALLAVLLIVPIIGLALGTSLYRSIGAPAVASVPTPRLPIIIVATAPAVVPPTPVAAQLVKAQLPGGLARAVVAYDAPNGNVIGAIEAGRAYQVLARYGVDWLQADVTGSGVVWLKADQVLDLPSNLADLAPPPAPAVVYVSAPAAPPAAAPVVDAVPTPAPPAFTTASTPPLAPQQAAILDRQQWAMDVQKEWIHQESCVEHPDWCK